MAVKRPMTSWVRLTEAERSELGVFANEKGLQLSTAIRLLMKEGLAARKRLEHLQGLAMAPAASIESNP